MDRRDRITRPLSHTKFIPPFSLTTQGILLSVKWFQRRSGLEDSSNLPKRPFRITVSAHHIEYLAETQKEFQSNSYRISLISFLQYFVLNLPDQLYENRTGRNDSGELRRAAGTHYRYRELTDHKKDGGGMPFNLFLRSFYHPSARGFSYWHLKHVLR